MDLSRVKNPQLCQKKIDLLAKIPTDLTFNYQLTLDYHGVTTTLNSSRESILKLVRQLVPPSWIANRPSDMKLELNVCSIKDFNIVNMDWENEESPECLTGELDNYEIAIQRDFAGKMMGNTIYAIINEDMADGFFNVLRWFMPRKLLNIKKTVLHSSCVVINDKASFFLGHSGYGKSTLTTLVDDKLVLGDDMNILYQHQDSYQSQGAALGGLYDNKSILDLSFPVGAFYWLCKSSENKVEKMGAAQAYRKFISSCANVFWNETDPQVASAMMSLSLDVVKRYPFYNLYFSLNKGFWKYVK